MRPTAFNMIMFGIVWTLMVVGIIAILRALVVG